MVYSKNKAVQKFLEEIDLIDTEKSNFLGTIREIIFNHYPKIEENIMYGGILFSINKEQISGLFVYKNHVSLEFGKGYLMSDPDGILEGGGKFRRHLKIKSVEEIELKSVDLFVKQAVQ